MVFLRTQFIRVLPMLLLVSAVITADAEDESTDLLLFVRQAVAAEAQSLPDLLGIEILSVRIERQGSGEDLRPKMVFSGYLARQALRVSLSNIVETAIDSSDRTFVPPWAIGRKVVMDVDEMRISSSAHRSDVGRTLVIERAIDESLFRAASALNTEAEAIVSSPRVDDVGRLRVTRFDRESKHLSLTGCIVHPELLDRLRTELVGFADVDTVTTDAVITIDATLEPNDVRQTLDLNTTYALYTKAVDALRCQDGELLLDITEMLIRRGRRTAGVWYLRASGHVLSGDDVLAVGALRVAGEPRTRHQLFIDFQGPARLHLEDLESLGPFGGILHAPRVKPVYLRFSKKDEEPAVN